jgi:hypothetical protein
MNLAKFFKDSQLSIALNAYNCRQPIRMNRVWAYTVGFGNRTSIPVPRAPGPGFNWDPTKKAARPHVTNFLREFNGAWLPANAPRIGRNAVRYRFVFWIHRHEPTWAGRLTKRDEVFSITVWDREVRITV